MDIDILIPENLLLVIAEVMGIGILRPLTLPIVIMQDTIVVMLVDVYLGHKRPPTLLLAIVEQ